MPDRKIRFQILNNKISFAGVALCVVALVGVLFFTLLDLLTGHSNPYLGIFIYLVVPSVFVFGAFLIPLGLFIYGYRRRKEKSEDEAKRFPVFDLNQPYYRRLFMLSIGAGTLLFMCISLASYYGYEYTESSEFCGRVCHEPMKPEYTAYLASPHARVSCARCHIGPGASWFVRSKMAGAHQLIAVMKGSFSRPIESPVKNLRPAQEVCEQCHWPQQFYGAVEKDNTYYKFDETNSPWKIRMLIKVGGGNMRFGKPHGIHWHMLKNRVSYISTDKQRQQIPWVSVLNDDGSTTVYFDQTSGFSPENPPKGEVRQMDCIDCHNRPSHIFDAPSTAVDMAMGNSEIDTNLPKIKMVAVRALTGDYASHEDARAKIATQIRKFYVDHYPKIAEEKNESVAQAITTIQDIYQTNFFPAMKVSWKVYPDNIGHFFSPGCFRCHGPNHKSSVSGKSLSYSCETCHDIIAQGNPNVSMESSASNMPFIHPEDIGNDWKDGLCYDCHDGGLM